MLKKRFKNFIDKANLKFNGEYNYDNYNYINNITKSVVKCPKHGNFSVTPSTHISSSKYGGCKICRREKKAFENHYTNCLEAAKSCETKTEFMNKYRNLYSLAHTYKWIDIICSHMKVIGNKYKRCIYSYEFTAFKTVYVGLTYDVDNRHNQHARSGPIYDFAMSNNVKIPSPIQKTDYISLNNAIELEGIILNEYINNNWVILNKNKTGGLGGNKRSLNYTKDECFKIAKKYNKVSDCEKENYKVCEILRKNNWIEEAFSHIYDKYKLVSFTLDGNFFEIFKNGKEASKKLRLNESGVYNSASNNSKFTGNYKFIKWVDWVKMGKPYKIKKINKTPSNSIKIKQLDLNGKVIFKFDSIADAVKSLNKKENAQTAIGKACKGKLKTAYGYRWEYV